MLYVTDENENLLEIEQLNLWTSVWTRPRQTVRFAINNKTMKFAVVLAMIAGIPDVLDLAVQNNSGDSITAPMIIILSILLGPLLGWIGWWVGSGISYVIGTWIGGYGTFEEMKMAMAISYIPIIIGSILWLPDVLIVGEALFTEAFNVSLGQNIWFSVSSAIGVVLSIWGFIILIKAIAEVHQFSSWRGLLTILIPLFIIILLILPIVFA